MKRLMPYALLGCLLVSSTAAASPVLTIDAPLSFESGTPFDVTIALTGAEDFSLYTIKLILSAPTGSQGVDYFFTGAAEPSDRYVFDGLVSDGFAYSILNDSEHCITLSDLLIFGSVTTVDGVNDHVAYVTVGTTASMLDDLTITVVSDSLELDSPASGTIDGFNELKGAIPVSTIPVPEPASLLLFTLAAGFLTRRSKRLA